MAENRAHRNYTYMKQCRTVESRFFRILSIILVWTGVFLGIGGTFLGEYYAGSRPRVAQPEVGRVYSLDNHGIIGYVTKVELLQVRLLEGGGIFCFVWGALIYTLRLRVEAKNK